MGACGWGHHILYRICYSLCKMPGKYLYKNLRCIVRYIYIYDYDLRHC